VGERFQRRAAGATWQALLSREPYGFHMSVSGKLRQPTDEEVEAARVCFLPDSVGLVERPNPVGLNPYVRHFLPPDA
jgi:hypothetical protein